MVTIYFLEEVQNVRLLTHDGRRTTHGGGWWTKTFAIGHLTDPSDLEKNKGWSCFIHSPLNRTRGPWNTLLISTPVHQIILFWFLNFPHIYISYISMLNLYHFLRPLIRGHNFNILQSTKSEDICKVILEIVAM